MTATLNTDKFEQVPKGDMQYSAWAYAKELYQAITVLIETLEFAREFHFETPRSFNLVEAIDTAAECVSSLPDKDLTGVRFVFKSALAALDQAEARKGRATNRAEGTTEGSFTEADVTHEALMYMAETLKEASDIAYNAALAQEDTGALFDEAIERALSEASGQSHAAADSPFIGGIFALVKADVIAQVREIMPEISLIPA